MSLILRVAVQHEAIADNPVRHLDPIEAGSRKLWALTPQERREFLAWMQGISEDKEEARAQASARRRDLPDVVTFMLGTGVRIGEALGVRWCDVDLEGVPVVEGDELRAVPIVAITDNVVRHRGKGLQAGAAPVAPPRRCGVRGDDAPGAAQGPAADREHLPSSAGASTVHRACTNAPISASNRSASTLPSKRRIADSEGRRRSVPNAAATSAAGRRSTRRP